MKIKTALLPPLLFIFIFVVNGCGTVGKNMLGGAATGVSECDKLFDKVEQKTAGKNLTSNTNSPREGAYVFLRDDILPSLRKEMAKPNFDKKDLAEKCKAAYEGFVPPPPKEGSVLIWVAGTFAPEAQRKLAGGESRRSCCAK